MNVCTHSYSLVWYQWSDWERFIDWMALSGINLFLAMTGQEEIQYKVFSQFGLNDTQIRNWFNGPAFLTWSRGQNEYGAKIAGPLPRSFMRSQWALQKQILQRSRALGMSAQLPGFQGNVPIALKHIQNDTNITKADATGWMNSVDPLYASIADAWMRQLIGDFGTDHWYQLDGYFDGGTAPWLARQRALHANAWVGAAPLHCEWSAPLRNAYLAGCPVNPCTSFSNLADARAACEADGTCGGVTSAPGGAGPWQLRAGFSPSASPSNETSYALAQPFVCHHLADDASWYARGAAAYTGLNRTDAEAVWSFQGWAFVGWSTLQQASSLKSFIDATPAGKFNVIDMSTDGDGEWKMWDKSAFWGANFVWTTLHDFGGTSGLRGWLDHINQIPFNAGSNVWGTGFTPEGIDQNPVYYEFMLDANWRTKPVDDVTAHIVERSHRRYGLAAPSADVTEAWQLLVASAYAQDLSVQDGTGVPHLGAAEAWAFGSDRRTPSDKLCMIWGAWVRLARAAVSLDHDSEPFRYDLVNTAREVLAQLAGPIGQNFSDAAHANPIDAARVDATGSLYEELLGDIDELVATDGAFSLGAWLAMARSFAANATDCTDTGYETITDCARFFEWNARVQLTTWNPTPKDAAKIPDGPVDYASKHWSGLIQDYYAARVRLWKEQALADAARAAPLNKQAINRLEAAHAYNWTTATNAYPEQAVGDAVAVSARMLQKYGQYFATCSA